MLEAADPLSLASSRAADRLERELANSRRSEHIVFSTFIAEPTRRRKSTRSRPLA